MDVRKEHTDTISSEILYPWPLSQIIVALMKVESGFAHFKVEKWICPPVEEYDPISIGPFHVFFRLLLETCQKGVLRNLHCLTSPYFHLMGHILPRQAHQRLRLGLLERDLSLVTLYGHAL
jgi:hypothetical protein